MASNTIPETDLKPALAYYYQDGLYLNITNRCPTACSFCVKRPWQWRYRGWNLKLNGEPPVAAILAEARKAAAAKPAKELVFCGYGEPTYRLDVIRAVAAEMRREFPSLRRRLNTVGLGNAIWKGSIVPDLKDRIEAVSVSLNAANQEEWRRIQRPAPAYRNSFEDVLSFIRECVAAGLETRVTAVEGIGSDPEAVRAMAQKLGAEYFLRPSLDDEN
ncbi:MAG TPA: TatD family nuclease-associated radical SAM protein [Elusimicrobiota bacterium]|nr:TatD family nuclease-associated radical SAM protein [Elusimicrobiota bacterium]